MDVVVAMNTVAHDLMQWPGKLRDLRFPREFQRLSGLDHVASGDFFPVRRAASSDRGTLTAVNESRGPR